jgi:peptidoglycan/xylan/chitin deacetylase (PgdA/CDA1 family)
MVRPISGPRWAEGEPMNTAGYVGLTFDDGPNPASARPLLDALAKNGATATFFIWGVHAQQNPELLVSVREAGMAIGNHTYTHPYLTRIGPLAAYDEIERTQQIIQAITGQTPTLFRPPYGDTDDQIRSVAARLGLIETLWTVDTRDWTGAPTEAIVRAASTVAPGGVILMHDIGVQSTVDAVPLILRVLADRGLVPGRIVPAENGAAGKKTTVVAP